nr:hypothetical protein [uncultured Caulobacter sp.]
MCRRWKKPLKKLALLKAKGPTPAVFIFKTPFPPPTGKPVEPELDECA